MITVTKKEFYDFVNPRDIVLESHEKVTTWKTRGGLLIGESSGYLQTEDVCDKWYKLTDAAYEELSKVTTANG